ncbi:MAG: PstS family phosphate ABC transporter substrate-binding protein [Cyanobacteria bacterium J069]|nr:MAG: PstS family phosphate ABC transporter substrate-binding protein [Cyanobacteria bacterium J069]
MVANSVKLNRFVKVLGAIAATVAAVGVPIAVFSQTNRLIKIDGSSTVFPITEAMAEEFMKINRGINITVGISGTGGGFSKFCAGETDISNASRPIKQSEIDKCKAAGINYIELPVAFDALTVVVNPRNTWSPSLTTAELKKIWEPGSTVNSWNQVRTGFPNRPLVLYGAGTDSGTFDYFTEAINGKSGDSRSDYTASEDDNVLVQGVSQDENALGYFGYAYYEENQRRLKAVAIDNGSGTAVAPSRAAVENNTYTPLSRPIFIYVTETAAQRPEVRQFVSFYLSSPQLVDEVGYIRLPQEGYTLAREVLERNQLGTRFANRETVGVSIQELLRLEAQR